MRNVDSASAQKIIDTGYKIANDCTSLREEPPVAKMMVKKTAISQNWTDALADLGTEFDKDYLRLGFQARLTSMGRMMCDGF